VWVIVLVIFLIAGIGVTLFWFEPQQLFIDDEVNEALPGPPDGPAGDDKKESEKESESDDKESAPGEPKTLASGTFTALNHDARGEAIVIDVDGDLYLRFEEFEVENGPDLRVYLSSEPSDGDPAALDEDFVDLGDLKGNVGPQNYLIPPDVDLGKYGSAVVWCRRFSVGFAVADVST
jgi:hypothetical protein